MPAKKKRKQTGDLTSPASRARIMAKLRRDQENEELTNMAHELPLPTEVKSKLDKISIMRLALSFLQLKQYMSECNIGGLSLWDFDADAVRAVHRGLPATESSASTARSFVESFEALDILHGFVISVDKEGTVLFASENMKDYIGYDQTDMIGMSLYDYIHPLDQKTFTKQMKAVCTMRKDKDSSKELPTATESYGYFRRNFHLHMCCSFDEQDSKLKKKGFLPIHFVGKLLLNQEKEVSLLICLCRPLDSTPLLEIRHEGNFFQSQLSLDLKYIFVEPRIINLLGYEPKELIGNKVYNFHCPSDADVIKRCHESLLKTGKGASTLYRFLGKNTEWIWMKSRGSVVYNTENVPQYISCITFIIGEDEAKKAIAANDSKPFMGHRNSKVEQAISSDTGSSEGSPSTSSTEEVKDVPKVTTKQVTVRIPVKLADVLQTMTLSEIMELQALNKVSDSFGTTTGSSSDLEILDKDKQQICQDISMDTGQRTQDIVNPVSIQEVQNIPESSYDIHDIVTYQKVNSKLQMQLEDLRLSERTQNAMGEPEKGHPHHKHSIHSTYLAKKLSDKGQPITTTHSITVPSTTATSDITNLQSSPIRAAVEISELEKLLVGSGDKKTKSKETDKDSKRENEPTGRPILEQLLTGKISSHQAIEMSRPETPPLKQTEDLFSEIAMPLSPGSKLVMDDMVDLVNNIESQDNTIYNYWSDSMASMSSSDSCSTGSQLFSGSDQPSTMKSSLSPDEDYSFVEFSVPSTDNNSSTARDSDSSTPIQSTRSTPQNIQSSSLQATFVDPSPTSDTCSFGGIVSSGGTCSSGSTCSDPLLSSTSISAMQTSAYGSRVPYTQQEQSMAMGQQDISVGFIPTVQPIQPSAMTTRFPFQQPINIEQSPFQQPINIDQPLFQQPINIEQSPFQQPINNDQPLFRQPINIEQSPFQQPIYIGLPPFQQPINIEQSPFQQPIDIAQSQPPYVTMETSDSIIDELLSSNTSNMPRTTSDVSMDWDLSTFDD